MTASPFTASSGLCICARSNIYIYVYTYIYIYVASDRIEANHFSHVWPLLPKFMAKTAPRKLHLIWVFLFVFLVPSESSYSHSKPGKKTEYRSINTLPNSSTC